MKISFSKMLLASAAMAAVTMAAVPAMAETTNIKVPFSFTVNGHDLPAGIYTVQRDASAGTLRLGGTYATQGIIWTASPSADKNTSNVTLQFDEIDHGHALRSVQYGALITARLDKKSVKSEDISPRVMAGQ